MQNVTVIENALIENALSKLRNKNGRTMESFSNGIKLITNIMGCEVLKNLPLYEMEVETPLKSTMTKRISSDEIPMFVPLLRAGLGMLEPMKYFFPNAEVAFLDFTRIDIPSTNNDDIQDKVEIQSSMKKIPSSISGKDVIILDIMLATGSTVSKAIQYLKEEGAGNIKLMCIISCPEGIRKVNLDYPDVEIYTAAIDEGLNKQNYIVPGVGDAGDILYGAT